MPVFNNNSTKTPQTDANYIVMFPQSFRILWYHFRTTILKFVTTGAPKNVL